jgi:hypothetical protein
LICNYSVSEIFQDRIVGYRKNSGVRCQLTHLIIIDVFEFAILMPDT